MLVRFGVTNKDGVEHISAIDVSKAGKFAEKLEACCPGDWRIAGVVID